MPSTSYAPRGGIFSGFSSGLSTLNSPPRLLPMSPRINKYSPLLPTISETTPLSAYPRRPLPRISSPRVVPAYRPPRPINIDTADIDVTTPRKRTDRVLRDRDNPQQGTIKRERTVVRIHTKRLKENPELVQNRRKTPGEKLVEKFLIKDKAAEAAKRKKLEEEASSFKRVYRDSALVKVEAGNSAPPGRQDAQGDEGLIDFDEPEETLAKEQVPGKEEQDAVKVTQSEALDILLSETECETVAPTPSKTRVSVKDKENRSNTIKKRPKKRGKECTVKTVDSKVAEVTQKPVEKSLLQRRNTVKNLRRNSHDIKPLALVTNEKETSILSTSTGPLPNPDSSRTSLPTESTTSTPVDSTSSTPVSSAPITPPLDFVSDTKSEPLNVIKSVVPESDCLQRDTSLFKAKDSDCISKPNIYNILSAEASVENAGDLFKKMPLKFVVDEIKVEETPKSPKSPKSFRYEVTVEEIPDKYLPFQKQGSDGQSEFFNENGVYMDRDATHVEVKNELKQAGNAMQRDSSLIYTHKEETENNCGGILLGKTVGIIPKGPTQSETVSQVEVSLSNVGEDNTRQVDAVSFSSGNSSNEKGENREMLMSSEISNIPSVSPTVSKQDTDEGSRLPEAELKSEEFFSVLPKEESKTLPIEKKLKKFENLKDKPLTNKLIINREETAALKVKDAHRTEKDICSKKLVESSKTAEKNSSRQIFENMLAVDQRSDRPDIPAWKKALIAKTQADNASKLQESVGLQHKTSNLKLSPISPSPNKVDSVESSSNTLTETNLKTCVDLPNKEAATVSQEIKTTANSMSTISCSESSNLKITEQQEIVETKSVVSDTVCGNSTTDKTDPQLDKSEPGEMLDIEVTEKHKADETFSTGQEIKPSEEADIENEMKVPADLYANNGQASAVKTEVVENKLKCDELLSAGKAKSAKTQFENVKLNCTDISPIGVTNATETQLKDRKLKPAKAIFADEMKPAKMKVTDRKLKPPASSEQSSPAMNVTEDRTKSSALVKLGTPEMKPLDIKVKSVETSPVEGKAHIPESAANEVNFVTEITAATEVKSVDKKIIPVAGSPVENMKSTETEISSAKEPKEPESREILNHSLEPPSLSSSSPLTSIETRAVDKSESVETTPKPLSVGNETQLEKRKHAEKKDNPVETKVLGHPEFCETLAVEKEKPGVTSISEEEKSAGDAVVVGPKLTESEGNAETNPVVSVQEETSSEAETDSEEETESETDSDDGERVTRPSHQASNSSSEDSGFDSLPTSVPGSLAYNKGPNNKGTHLIF